MESVAPRPVAPRPWPFSKLRTPAAAACAVLVLLGCHQAGDERRGEPSADAPAVEALRARSGTLPLEERLSGVVKAQNQVAIRAEINAPIVEVLVKSGEAVERGQPLVRLKDDTLREQLRRAEAGVRLSVASAKEAQARLAEREAQVRRTRALAEQALVSELEGEGGPLAVGGAAS